MTEEIKEIFKTKLYFDLDETDYIKIQNHITNLQKENENLSYEINGYLEEKKKLKEKINKLEDYKSRNEKAFELLQLLHYKFADGDSIHHDIEDIQKELQGGDE